MEGKKELKYKRMYEGREGPGREVNDCFGFAFIAISELSTIFQKRNQNFEK